MIVRTLKLKLTKEQENILTGWLWNLTGVWNWAIKKIGNDAQDKVYHSAFDFQNILKGHGDKIGIPSHTLQGICCQAHAAWKRCFKKIAKAPRLKGNRNKLNSIPFPDPIKTPADNRVSIPLVGSVKYHKQELPSGKIKCGRVIKRSSGWYLALWIDATHKFPVKETSTMVGIDPGFSSLLTLSTGTKIENPRELRKGAERYAQAQRGNDKQLSARLQERQANRRKDRNHKISRWLVENYKTICYSDDNFKEMAKQLGKSVSEASLGNLIGLLSYKSSICGRTLIPVNSAFTTMTCSACGAKSGPTGWGKLAVRQWDCACGARHDRDCNAAKNVLFAGLGTSHERKVCHAN